MSEPTKTLALYDEVIRAAGALLAAKEPRSLPCADTGWP